MAHTVPTLLPASCREREHSRGFLCRLCVSLWTMSVATALHQRLFHNASPVRYTNLFPASAVGKKVCRRGDLRLVGRSDHSWDDRTDEAVPYACVSTRVIETDSGYCGGHPDHCWVYLITSCFSLFFFSSPFLDHTLFGPASFAGKPIWLLDHSHVCVL